MTKEVNISTEKAACCILNGTALSFGFHKAYYVDLPQLGYINSGFFDLIGGEHDAWYEEDVLFLSLWFTDAGATYPNGTVLDRREIRSSFHGLMDQVKLKMAVSFVDIEYVNLEDRRVWIDQTERLLMQDTGAELNRKKVEEWERAWSTYILKLNRLDELKDMGRHGYQLRQPYKAIAMAANKLKELDADFCERMGII